MKVERQRSTGRHRGRRLGERRVGVDLLHRDGPGGAGQVSQGPAMLCAPDVHRLDRHGVRRGESEVAALRHDHVAGVGLVVHATRDRRDRHRLPQEAEAQAPWRRSAGRSPGRRRTSFLAPVRASMLVGESVTLTMAGSVVSVRLVTRTVDAESSGREVRPRPRLAVTDPVAWQRRGASRCACPSPATRAPRSCRPRRCEPADDRWSAARRRTGARCSGRGRPSGTGPTEHRTASSVRTARTRIFFAPVEVFTDLVDVLNPRSRGAVTSGTAVTVNDVDHDPHPGRTAVLALWPSRRRRSDDVGDAIGAGRRPPRHDEGPAPGAVERRARRRGSGRPTSVERPFGTVRHRDPTSGAPCRGPRR